MLIHPKGPIFSFQSAQGRHGVGCLRLWPFSFYWARTSYEAAAVVPVSQLVESAVALAERQHQDKCLQAWTAIHQWLDGTLEAVQEETPAAAG